MIGQEILNILQNWRRELGLWRPLYHGREGAAEGDREAVHACGGLGVRLEGWVEGQEVRGDGLFAVEEGESLLRRVHRLYHGQRRSLDDRKGRSTSGPGGPSGSAEEES